MLTIRKKLSLLFLLGSVITVVLIVLFVNITINNKFNEYMLSIQDKRYESIVSHLEETYKATGEWTAESEAGLIHEAYMGNYCLTLMDSDRNVIWGMDPKIIINNTSHNMMNTQDEGVYTSKTFELKDEGEIIGYVDIGQYSPVLLSQEDVNFISSINKSIVITSLFTLVVIFLINSYVSKQFSNPIKNLANISVGLSQGTFNAKLDKASNVKEIEDLRCSVNILASKLEYQDRLRKQLVSDISHEIRTPLNVLQNNLEALIDGVFPVTTERLSYLNDEVIRFGKLLDNLNALKEFESESAKFNYERIDLEELLQVIYNEFSVVTQNKDIKFSYSIDKDKRYFIIGDYDRIKQVFINIINNSVKFTNTGNIGINLSAKNDKIIVDVKDTGIGICKEDLPYIFERMYRGDKSRNHTEGSGIGLTVVKSILQLHGATIHVESELNQGTLMRISFNSIM